MKFQWDYQQVITSMIKAGGDTDTTAAIAGALCGAFGGTKSIPHDWISHIAEWPTGTKELRVLAHAIQNHTPLRVRHHWSPALLLRNLVFLITVLIHGFARLAPANLRSQFSK